MKKIITICLLAFTLLASGITMEAKTTKKKSKPSNTKSTVIGKYTYQGMDYQLLSNGKIKTKDKCITGNHTKNNGYYDIVIESGSNSYKCGDWVYFCIIVDDNVYLLGGGTDEWNIWKYNYNNKNGTITFINHMGKDNEKEFLKYNDLPSLTVPLSHFEKVGKVTWTK